MIMAALRVLNDGSWNKPPVLTAARKLLIDGLSEYVQARPLKELASFLNGTSYEQELLSNEGTPIIRISNMSNPRSEYISTREVFDSKYRVRHGDLLVSWSASFKSIIWPGPDGILNQHIFKVTELPGNRRNFIRHAIEAVFGDMQQRVVGIGMMHLRRDDFLGHLVPAPDSETQRCIGTFLDWVESGREGAEPELPKKLQKQRRIIALFEELVAKIEEARCLRREAQLELEAYMRHSAFDLFPPASLRETVGDFIGFQTGYAFKSEWFTDAGIRLVRNANIGHGTLDWNDTVRISDERREEFLPFELQRGDILITLDRPIISTGVKVARVRDEDLPCLLLQRVARPQFKSDRILPDYFYCWLLSPHFANAIDPGRSNGVPHISHKDIEKIPFAAPLLPEQLRVVAHFDKLQARVNNLKRLQSGTAQELDALIPSILSKAFSGEL